MKTQNSKLSVDNVIYIEFSNKKGFPTGPWLTEPDFCSWEAYDLPCVAIRDMKLGMWRGFVGIDEEHIAHGKTLHTMLDEEWGINLKVHGEITLAGKLPKQYLDISKDYWWFGFECVHGEDLLPLVGSTSGDDLLSTIQALQTYKNLHFVRKETTELAKQLFKINRK